MTNRGSVVCQHPYQAVVSAIRTLIKKGYEYDWSKIDEKPITINTLRDWYNYSGSHRLPSILINQPSDFISFYEVRKYGGEIIGCTVSAVKRGILHDCYADFQCFDINKILDIFNPKSDTTSEVTTEVRVWSCNHKEVKEAVDFVLRKLKEPTTVKLGLYVDR